MKYFTFLGLGKSDGGYDRAIYEFNDEYDDIKESRFVQIPITDRFKEDIDQIYVFVTKESYERYYSDLNRELNEIKYFKIEYIMISIDIDFNDFVGEIFKRIRRDDQLILDITHSYRNIPMKLLFALKYIELSTSCIIEHLYYGQFDPSLKTGKFIDFIDDYHMQAISDLLSQFNRTLSISSKNVETFLEDDPKMNEFLKALTNFNQMIELCEFDHSLEAVDKIILQCRTVERDIDKYIVIIPIVKAIRNKFDKYNLKTTKRDKKAELIRILLSHERYQLAITFVDQFFREEIIRTTLDPADHKFDLRSYLKNHDIKANKLDSLEYDLSQELIINKYKLRKQTNLNFNKPKVKECLKDKQKNIDEKFALLQQYKPTVDHFYASIRNHMNHGTSISNKNEISGSVEKMLECIEKM